MNKRSVAAIVFSALVLVVGGCEKGKQTTEKKITNAPLPDGLYKVTGRQSGKLLDISLTDSARLNLHGPAPNNGVGGANQKFNLQYDSSTDAYKIVTYNGQCLDAAGEVSYNNRLIHQYDCKNNNVSNQRFRLRHIEGDWWQIMVVQGTERCLDVIECSVGDKSWVNEWECKRPPADPNTNNCSLRIDNQLWKFEPPDPPPTPPPSPSPTPPPTAASQLSDASVCGPPVSGSKSCKLKIRNKSDRDIFGYVCWSNAIPPQGYNETCLPLEKTDIKFPKGQVLDVPGASGVFPAAAIPAVGFRATAHY